MTTIKTAPFDAAEYLDSEEAIAAYLSATLEEDDPALFLAALADVAKARGLKAHKPAQSLAMRVFC